jgi:hypothetical protein
MNQIKKRSNTILEGIENNMFKWYQHTLRVRDNRSSANTDLAARMKKKKRKKQMK